MDEPVLESRGVQQESGAFAERGNRRVHFSNGLLERARPYMSDEHFTVDGTLIEAWASQKSSGERTGRGSGQGREGEVDFSRRKRKNQTHESTNRS